MMKRTTLFLIVPTLLAALTLMLLPTQPAAMADGEGSEADETIHEAMEVINDNFRMVRRQADEPEMNADTAERLSLIIAATVEAKGAFPSTATSDELRTTYTMMMNSLLVELAQAENAALSGDNDALEEHVAAANNIRREGHAAFIPEED